jgi:hypothetical protein
MVRHFGRQPARMNDDETLRKRSGWLIPLSVFGVTFVLSAMILLYYLAPTSASLFTEEAAPTSRSDLISLKVGGRSLRIPANYLIYDSARSGGERATVALYALLPDFSGWSNWAANDFSDNTAESRVVYLTVREDRLSLKEADKLARVYRDYLAHRNGTPGPNGLTQYAFRADSGYRNEDLFVGTNGGAPVVLRCVQRSDTVPSPSCLREVLLAPGVSLAIRFKRTQLESWQKIAVKSDALIASFAARSK